MAKQEGIRPLLKMKEGSVYSPKQLHDNAKAVADAYGSGGYVDLVITPESSPAGPPWSMCITKRRKVSAHI